MICYLIFRRTKEITAKKNISNTEAVNFIFISVIRIYLVNSLRVLVFEQLQAIEPLMVSNHYYATLGVKVVYAGIIDQKSAVLASLELKNMETRVRLHAFLQCCKLGIGTVT